MSSRRGNEADPPPQVGGYGGRIWTLLGPFLILVFVNLLFAALLAWKDSANETEDLKNFFSFANLVIVLTQTVIVAIGALGMTMIIVSGGIDLSVGSVIAFTSVLGAVMIREGQPLLWVAAATILAGGCIGLVNGFLISAFNLMP